MLHEKGMLIFLEDEVCWALSVNDNPFKFHHSPLDSSFFPPHSHFSGFLLVDLKLFILASVYIFFTVSSSFPLFSPTKAHFAAYTYTSEYNKSYSSVWVIPLSKDPVKNLLTFMAQILIIFYFKLYLQNILQTKKFRFF